MGKNISGLILLLVFSGVTAQNTFFVTSKINDVGILSGVEYQNRTKSVGLEASGFTSLNGTFYVEVKFMVYQEIGKWNLSFTPLPSCSLKWRRDSETSVYQVKKRTPLEVQFSRNLTNKLSAGITYRLYDHPQLQLRYAFTQRKLPEVAIMKF